MTNPFFTVEMTRPDGKVQYEVANYLGNASFDNMVLESGQTYSFRVFDKDGKLVDLTDPTLFENPASNQSSITVK